MSVYPYKLGPLFKDKIWGGRSLERLYGKDLPAGEDVGESWELADLAEGESSIVNGPRAGQSLRQVVAEEGAGLTGAVKLLDNGRFPLLLKLLDAHDTLSLQVHPDEQAAAEIPGAALKTECWYILESRDGFIYKGVQPGVSGERFRAALESDDVEQLEALLIRFECKAGDFHFLPAGTLHAVGKGLVVAEVQTPSDTTYRVSDWGRGREIHVERAMQCTHFKPPAESVPGAGGDCLLKTDYFEVYKRQAEAGSTVTRGGRCVAWMLLDGAGRIESDTPDPSVEFAAGDTLLLPAGVEEITARFDQPAAWLEITLPPF